MDIENRIFDADDVICRFKSLLDEARKTFAFQLKGSKYFDSSNDVIIISKMNLFSSLLKANIIKSTEIKFMLKLIQKIRHLLPEENNVMFANSMDLFLIFISCFVISHKFLNDIHRGNEYFSFEFGICRETLNRCVEFCLLKLEYDLYISF
jgi:hypothetical protein